MSDSYTISVGLEEGADGAFLVHSLSPPGCVAGGATREEALASFEGELHTWLEDLVALGERLPAADAELQITVDDWVRTDANVEAGESTACFEEDLRPLDAAEIQAGLQRLGDLRGLLLTRIRRIPDAELDRAFGDGWTVRRTLDELARAQWWTLSRLGASPLAEIPVRTLARLDTAMALVVQQFTREVPKDPGRALELEGEVWTPRKVMRRLLWLEWTLGRVARAALTLTE